MERSSHIRLKECDADLILHRKVFVLYAQLSPKLGFFYQKIALTLFHVSKRIWISKRFIKCCDDFSEVLELMNE
jgi:hypothetical protein